MSSSSISPASFLSRFLRNPRAMSSITPSSRALARAIAKLVGDDEQIVLELGAGNGALTGALVKQGRTVIAIERDRDLAQVVARNNPGVSVSVCDAKMAPFVLRDRGIDHVPVVVSGLGLKAMDDNEIENIAWAIDKALETGGRWIQFSYTSSSPVPGHVQDKYGLVEARHGRVVNNLPPAYLFSYTKT